MSAMHATAGPRRISLPKPLHPGTASPASADPRPGRPRHLSPKVYPITACVSASADPAPHIGHSSCCICTKGSNRYIPCPSRFELGPRTRRLNPCSSAARTATPPPYVKTATAMLPPCQPRITVAAAAVPARALRRACPSTCCVGRTPPRTVRWSATASHPRANHLVLPAPAPAPGPHRVPPAAARPCSPCRSLPHPSKIHPCLSRPSPLAFPRTLQQAAQLPVVPQQGRLHSLGPAGALLVQLLWVAGGGRCSGVERGSACQEGPVGGAEPAHTGQRPAMTRAAFPTGLHARPRPAPAPHAAAAALPCPTSATLPRSPHLDEGVPEALVLELLLIHEEQRQA